MSKRWLAAFLIMTVVAVPGAAPLPAGRPTVMDGFRRIQQVAKSKKMEELEVYVPSTLVSGRDGFDAAKVTAWRTALAAEISSARYLGMRERTDSGVIRYAAAGTIEEKEILLAYKSPRWVLDSAQGYVVKGKSLDTRNGSGPVKVTLKARTSESTYGESACSFTHVTTDEAECKNRMDLWYCRCGRLHARGGSVTVHGSPSAPKADNIPIGASFEPTLRPAQGETYALRLADFRRDFYVKFRVSAVTSASLELEWVLLADGWNTPGSIRTPVPIPSADGADGCDAICHP